MSDQITKQIRITVSQKVLEQAREQATKRGQTLHEWIRGLIADELNRRVIPNWALDPTRQRPG